MFVKDRRLITKTVLSLINPDHTENDLDTAMATWWQNIRSTGGYGLSYAGSRAFDKAEIGHTEFEDGPSSHMGNMSRNLSLDRKMLVPYYFYSDKKTRKIKVYDDRVALLITLHENIGSYLQTLDLR